MMNRGPLDVGPQLPEYVASRPRARHWDRPTAWLLGAQIAGSLRRLLLSSIHTGFDLRDWMSPGEPFVYHRDGAPLDGGDEFWLDYLADTGDAPKLVYWLGEALQRDALEAPDGTVLRRGRVLVVGGDSAYPIADQAALRERVQAPLVWAYRKLHGLEWPPGGAPVVCDLFAIPGNHDYYDALDGFARQFRAPATAEDERCFKHLTTPPLRLPGYARLQRASYFALELPFGWRFWGVDLGSKPRNPGAIDVRQEEYFRRLPRPERLIVATSLPVAVHHRPDPELRHAFETQLGLEPAFLRGGRLSGSQLRIDLAGDSHLYERYWGTENYAAVTSGLGGAFHHPLQVRLGAPEARVAPTQCWPPEQESIESIGLRLLRPRKVFQAGSVGVLGAIVAVVLYLIGRVSSDHTVLDVPFLLAAGNREGAVAVLAEIAPLALWLLLFVLWARFVLKPLRAWTTRIRGHARIDPRARSQVWIERGLCGRRASWVMRLLGANPRVTATVLRQMPARIVGAATFGAIAALPWLGLSISGHHLALDVIVVLYFGGLIALPVLAVHRPWPGKGGIVLLGLVHFVAQVTTPYLWARASSTMLGLPVWFLLGYWCIRPFFDPLVRRRRRVALTAAWLLLVAGFVLAPLSFPGWPLAGTPAATGMAIALLACGTLGAVIAPNRWWKVGLGAIVLADAAVIGILSQTGWLTGESIAVGVAMAAIGGAFFSCLWLGWYFLVCLQWNAHGNEAGAVARVDHCAEFLRIRLTREGAEVWAIAVRGAPRDDGDYAVSHRVVDRFVIRAPGGAA